MDQIVVPQFLDTEDRIIGPITTRQFLEMIVGGLFVFIFYKIFDFSLFVLSSLIVVALTILFAFVKVNGQKFHYFLLNFIATMKKPKLKIWKKVIETTKEKKEEKLKEKVVLEKTTQPIVSSSRLSELSLIVDTGGVYRGEEKL